LLWHDAANKVSTTAAIVLSITFLPEVIPAMPVDRPYHIVERGPSLFNVHYREVKKPTALIGSKPSKEVEALIQAGGSEAAIGTDVTKAKQATT
jgi:hypothetical protein